MGDSFNSALAYDGPIHLTSLQMGTAFDQPGVCAFGPIDEIEMDEDYNQSDFVVSRVTTRLYLGGGFKQPLRFEYGPHEQMVQPTEEEDEDDDVSEEYHDSEYDDRADDVSDDEDDDIDDDDHAGRTNAHASEAKDDTPMPSFYMNASESSASSDEPRRGGKLVHFHNQARANNPRLYAATFGKPEDAAAAVATSSTTSSTHNHVMLSVLRVLSTAPGYDFPCHGLPGSLKFITFGAAFKCEFSFYTPPTLTRLTLPGSRPELSVPAGTRHLRIVGNYEPPHLIVPTGVRRLELNGTFNRPLQFQEPCSLRTWNMPYDFNVPGMLIPAGMESLRFGARFNQPVTFSSESRLRKIDMGGDSDFNHDICLPSSITHITEGSDFQSKVTFAGHAILKEYKMSNYRNSPGFRIDGASVVKFTMGHNYDQADFVMPEGVRFFQMGECFNKPLRLREPLREFRMGPGFNASLIIDSDCKLRAFYGGLMFNQTGLRLPHTLRDLQLSERFKQAYYILFPKYEIRILPPRRG